MFTSASPSTSCSWPNAKNANISHRVYGIRVRDTRATVAEDAGVCFPLSEIEQCKIEKGIMGAVNCSVTMRDGCFLKLQMPKLGGLGGGMPHHAEYREAILSRLRTLE